MNETPRREAHEDSTSGASITLEMMVQLDEKRDKLRELKRLESNRKYQQTYFELDQELSRHMDGLFDTTRGLNELVNSADRLKLYFCQQQSSQDDGLLLVMDAPQEEEGEGEGAPNEVTLKEAVESLVKMNMDPKLASDVLEMGNSFQGKSERLATDTLKRVAQLRRSSASVSTLVDNDSTGSKTRSFPSWCSNGDSIVH